MTLVADIGVRVGDHDVDLSLVAEAGRTMAVVGPNGAGKTTALRVLAGLLPLDRGRIVLDGTVLDDPAAGTWVPPEARRAGVVFQGNLLFPHLDAIDNVAFGLRSRRVARRAARAAAHEWLERVGLGDRGDARPSELSGGEAQRVALARALAAEPSMLLLDEPMSALDVETRGAVRRDLQRHLRSFGGVRIIVTHDAVDAAILGDELVVVEGGRVVQRGRADELAARPRSSYVARLAGTNLFRGHATRGVVAVDGGGSLVTVSEDDGAVLAVVPPHAVAVATSEPAGSPRNVWRGTINAIEGSGPSRRLQIGGSPPIVAEVTASAVAALGLREGELVWVSVKATEIDVYPA